MAKDFVTPEQYQRGVGKIKDYVDTQHYYEYPTIHYDSTKYNKGYVDVTELKPDIIYKMPKYPEVELGSLGKIALCCKNDDGSLFMINNDGNTLGFNHMMNPMLFLMAKTDKFVLIRYKSYENNYSISLSKNNGIWSISNFTSITPYPGSKYEYTPSTDYSPATKKYVDDTANTLVKKDTNKYILITNDDTLVIKKSDITDIADATITIDNLTGKFGALVANDDGTYSYTLNNIMTDVETFIFKVNNVEQKLVIVPYREMQYDDKNAGITYSDNWTIEENTNCYKNSLHKKNDKNISSHITMLFKGTAIDVIGILPNKTEFDVSTMTYRIFKGQSTDTANRIVNKTFYLNATNTEYKSKLNLNENVLEFNLYTLQCVAPKNNNLYIDSIIIYDTLGDNINQTISNLYDNYNSNSVLYTNKANYKFSPTRLYDPTTKKYVDELVENSKTAMCTDEEVDNMLNEVLGGDYSGK